MTNDKQPTMWSWFFWKQTIERIIGSAAASLLATLTASGVLDIVHVGWKQVLGIAGLAAVATLAKCLVAVTIGQPDSPSLVSTDPKDA